MHRSRLKVVLVDSPADDAETEVAFWSAALGRNDTATISADDPYARVGTLNHSLDLMVQRIDGERRTHVDIETDNVDAEVSRLEKLGAVKTEKVQSWWVMKSPAGHIFCVVPKQSDDFPDGANVWE